MTQMTQSKLGNTKPVCKSRKWCLTLNNYTETEHSDMLKIFTMKNWSHIVAEEVGTNDTPHLQIYVEAKNAIRFTALKKLFPRAHIEVAKGNKTQNLKYCMKDGKYVTNMEVPHIPKKLRDPLDGKELFPFQKTILELIKTEPDERKIYWYWDATGCQGKTTLAKHICMNHNALYVQGKATDIKYGVLEMIAKKGEIDIVIMGLPRSYEDYVSYDAIESVKDGIFFSSKYESGMCIFNSPHVIIFANFPPKTEKLSADRWVIERLDTPSEDDIETEGEDETTAQFLYDNPGFR